VEGSGIKFEDANEIYISIFRHVTSCSPLKINRHFGGICPLNLHVLRAYQARNQHVAGSK
jgi:hypothetical protein